ncbi:MAG: Carbohydrate family 9 binding domain-like, partial [Bacteroidota bacterium]
MLYAQEIQANRTSDKIVVDGNLEESIWLTANFVEEFTQISPNPGVKSSQNTKVAMAYSSDAIYFAAICYDHPDS